MPCPHNEITIVQRSQRQSAIAAAAYQSGEKLFCEYDQEVKHYPEKRGMKLTRQTAPVNACSAALPTPLTFSPLTVPATADLSRSWCTRSKPRFTFWRTKPLPEPISSRCGQKRWKFTEAAGSSWLSALPCSGISKNTSGILCRRTPKPG